MVLQDGHFSGADAEYVTFAYDNEVILDDYSLDISAGKILGDPRDERFW